MEPEVSAQFIIFGNISSAEEITAVTGIEPTNIVEIRGKPFSWDLTSTYHGDGGLQEYAHELLTILLPKAKIVSAYCAENDLKCELKFTVFIDTDFYNGYDAFLTEETLSGLAKLNASVDIQFSI